MVLFFNKLHYTIFFSQLLICCGFDYTLDFC
uniref:Uncharacterized protein n=1 Tax=Anguilla anguilla TaxID=7936 RepID=A0A0E9VG01_ANGAN